MPRLLEKSLFTLQDLDLFQGFYCGDSPWEQEVANFIQGMPGGVRDDLDRHNQVWYYYTRTDGIVGFASLGKSRWPWPLHTDPVVPINLISMVGIDKRFWGKPDGPAEDRFSAQILDDLIAEARLHTARKPLLGLFVHVDNTRARRVYEKAGFVPFHKRYTDPDTGAVYEGMLLNL